MNLDEEYKKIAKLFKVKLFNGITQPVLSTKRFKGEDYIKSRNENEFKLDEVEITHRREIFNSIFQPEGKPLVFAPQNKSLFSSIMSGNFPHSIYVGLGYNKSLTERGERIDLFNVFTWTKRLQKILPNMKLIIWDASAFEIINRMSKDYTYSNTIAREILFDMKRAILDDKNLQSICKLRHQYLTRILSFSNINGEILRSADHFDEDLFIEIFQRVIEFFREPRSKKLRFSLANKFSEGAKSLYMILEVSEAIYLTYAKKCSFKVGPVTESIFDKAILKFSRQPGETPYTILWYTPVPDRPVSYLHSMDSITAKSSSHEIDNLLHDTDYVDWLKDILSPYAQKSSLKRTIEYIIKIIEND